MEAKYENMPTYEELLAERQAFFNLMNDLVDTKGYLERLNEEMQDEIKERKRIEDELKKTGARLIEAQSVSKIGSWETDLITLEVMWSVEIYKIFELDYKDFQSSHKSFLEYVHPEDKDKVDQAFVESFGTNETNFIDHRIITPFGNKKFVEERWYIIHDSDGNPLKAVGTCQDITERKQAEKALRESEARFRDIVNSSDGIVWEADAQTFAFTFISQKAERLLGYEINDWFQENFWAEHIHEDDKDYAIQYCIQCTKNLQDYDFEYRFVTKSGEVIWLRDIVSVVEENGQPRWLRGIMIDITKKKQIEEQQKLFAKILIILNKQSDLQNLIKDIIIEIKTFTGFDAIGIRLKEGNDYPYYEQIGFDKQFIKAENSLIKKDKEGKLCFYDNGMPILECTCGTVITGDVDKTKPYFTQCGSFFTNQSTVLLNLHPSEDPRINPRNTCIHRGFMSVCLMPIYSGNEIVGLLQLNDKKPDKLTQDIIEFFEETATAIGIAYNRIDTEKKIRESEKKFRAIIDASPVPKALNDDNQNITYLNQAFIQTFGYTLEDIPTLNDWWIRAYPDEEYRKFVAESWQVELDRAKRTDTKFTPMELNIRCKDGTIKTAIVGATSFTRAYENIHLVVLFDISERKRAEEELRDSEVTFRTLLNGIPLPLVHVSLDGVVLYRNKRFLDIIGYTIDEISSMDEWWLIAYPDEQYRRWVIQTWNASVAEAIKTGSDITSAEYQVTCNDGSLRLMIISGVIIGNSLLATFYDITERKRADEALRESEIELKRAQNLAQIGNWSVNFATNQVFWSEELYRMYGFDPALPPPLINESNTLFTSESWELLSNSIAKTAETGTPYEIELNLTRKDGSLGWMWARGEAIFGNEGQIIGVGGAVQDITERKQLENSLIVAKAKAEESDKLKTAFLQNMSHEIRTPLNGIIGFSGLLEEESLSKEEIHEFTNMIKNSGNRLIEIVNNILDISKIETGQIEVSSKPFSINEMLNDLYSFFVAHANNKELTLHYQTIPDESQSMLESDENKIHQVLTNLINNAIKFTSKGEVNFGCEIKGNEMLFFVKDTGIGISGEYKHRIFERFVQADLAITRGYEGAGLGLAISKGLVELLG